MPASRSLDSSSCLPCSKDLVYLWIACIGAQFIHSNSRTNSQPVLDPSTTVFDTNINNNYYNIYDYDNYNYNYNYHHFYNTNNYDYFYPCCAIIVLDKFLFFIVVVVVAFVVVTSLVSTMFRNKRKDSAIRTLVAETLVLAKTHGYVEKIEHELEEELQRENKGPPNRVFAKWRHKGEQLLKNKYTLLTVAIFCVTECALILGELILDLHKVKDVLEAQEEVASNFVQRLHTIYPAQVPSPDVQITRLFDRIISSNIQWNQSYPPFPIHPHQSMTFNNETRHKRSMGSANSDHKNNINDNSPNLDESNSYTNSKTLFIRSVYSNVVNNLTSHNNVTSFGADDVSLGSSNGGGDGSSSGHGGHGSTSFSEGHSLEEEIAHALHMASITILSILVFQTILKALCAGTAFFHRRLETFDLCVVLISFVVDLVCMQIMPRYKIQDFVFILAFLLPWRVIRVVNSLVVAVQDHEHFRLKLIYGRKKKILNSLRESEVKIQLFRAQCNALKRLCYNEGIEEAKVDQILMVEECVVTKAGKSKCKVKIDNSSVIVLNDKSDFPRLSPRPSILNLFDYGSRRKSMQPQSLSSNDRELFLKTGSKDSSSKKSLGFLRTRTRSNSESGRGTLSSPDESGTGRGQNSFGESAISGLNTPVLIDRKSSLNSPIIANHVKNILSSLEGGIGNVGGGGVGGGVGGGGPESAYSSVAYRYGRGSLDEGKKQGSRESEGKVDWMKGGSKTGSMDSSGGVDGGGGGSGMRGSISNDVGGVVGGNGCNGSGSYGRNGAVVGPAALPTLKSRRGSLQPQKRVDEDEDDSNFIQVPPPPPPPSHPHTSSVSAGRNATTTASVHQDKRRASHDGAVVSGHDTTVVNIPYTASVMPQAITTSPNSSKAIGASQTTTEVAPSSNPSTQLCLASIEQDAEDCNNSYNSPPNQQQQQPHHVSMHPRRSLDYSIHESPHENSPEDANLIELNESKKPSTTTQPAGFKPKTFRTPSDIENENNLTTANDFISTSPPTSNISQSAMTPTEPNGTSKFSGHGTPLVLSSVRHSSITEEEEVPEQEKEDEIMV